MYAAQFSVSDVQLIIGANPPLQCIPNIYSGGFYTYTLSGYAIDTTIGISGFIASGNFYGGSIANTGQTITSVYLIGPVPSSTGVLAIAGPCALGQFCSIPTTAVTCPGTYHLVALQNNNQANVVSAAC